MASVFLEANSFKPRENIGCERIGGEVLYRVFSLKDPIYYQAPDAFVRFGSEHEEEDRRAAYRRVEVEVTTLTGTELAKGGVKGEITIARPPVLLVHGIWGGGKREAKPENGEAPYTWGGFESELKEKSPGFEIFPVDYSAFNAESFGHSKTQGILATAIEDTQTMIKDRSLSGKRVDIVVHSMGGLVVREYCKAKPDDCKNGIHKLITIDTPHRGSELADILLAFRDHRDQFPNSSFRLREMSLLAMDCHKRIDMFIHGSEKRKILPHPIDRGAVDNLAVGRLPDRLTKEGIATSPTGQWLALSSFIDLSIPSHVVVGSGLKKAKHSEMKALWNDLLIPCGFSRQDLFGSELENDFIVGKASQEGGMSQGSITLRAEDHVSVLETPESVEAVRQLLEEPAGSGRFSQ